MLTIPHIPGRDTRRMVVTVEYTVLVSANYDRDDQFFRDGAVEALQYRNRLPKSMRDRTVRVVDVREHEDQD